MVNTADGYSTLPLTSICTTVRRTLCADRLGINLIRNQKSYGTYPRARLDGLQQI